MSKSTKTTGIYGIHAGTKITQPVIRSNTKKKSKYKAGADLSKPLK